MSPIFSSAEPGPQLTWTAMLCKYSIDFLRKGANKLRPSSSMIGFRITGGGRLLSEHSMACIFQTSF
jgi:hypothetical protein